ncbi:hypothetical protein HBN82_13135 [Pseudomonas lundensis]|uniref:phage tail-collar fiber domain-containing protein n=1 Tax=Pseudomonas lundensis TaxID=86185 RepID=UPI001475FF90|nr:phage tail protein [Pseudomonas lundensis]NNA16799.1 hypothetical protein [Pseudomonas lundensis]
MGASITLAGESLIAQKQGNGQILDVTQIIFGFIPGLDTTQPVDRAAGFPAASNVVYTMSITRKGYLSPNQVVYSALLGSNIGDFDFNWIGLSTAEGTLLIAAYVPTQQKRKEIAPLQTGNNLTRNIVLEYDGARSLTGITVPASTWQFDFTTEFAAIRQDIANLKVALANPANAVSLDGPVLIYANSSNVYKITDYNRFSVFTATTSVGSVAISADTLTLTIPTGAAAGVVALEVARDGVKAPFKVALGASAIGAPSITNPVNLAVGVSLGVTLTTSAFIAYPATADTHKNTDWRIKNAAGVVVWQSLADAVNKTSITLPANALQPGVQYFLDARHNGVTLGSSPYSATVKFTTSEVSISTPTILSPINGASGVVEQPTITTSAFATVPAASDNHKSTNWRLRNYLGDVIWSSMEDTVNLTSIKLPAGLLSVSKNHTIDVQYNGITLPTTPWQSSGFTTVAAFEFGKYLAVAQTASPGVTVYGQDIDTLNKLTTPPVRESGTAVCLSPDGKYMMSGGGTAPYLQMLKRTGDSYSLLAAPSVVPNSAITALAISYDGNTCIAASNAGTYFSCVYSRDGDAFTYTGTLTSAATYALAFTEDGAYVAAGIAGGAPGLEIYKKTAGGAYNFLTKALGPSAPAEKCTFSADGVYVAFINSQVSPYVVVNKRTGDNFAKLADLTAYGTVSDVSLSRDGIYLAVALKSSPGLVIHKRTGDTFAPLAAPDVIPGVGTSCMFSSDGNYLAVGLDKSPWIYLYKRNGDVFNKLANPAVLPVSKVVGLSFYPAKASV